MKTLWSFLAAKARYDPRIYFILFILSNSVLSYSTLGIQIKVWIGICGIVVPWMAAILSYPQVATHESSNPKNESVLFPNALLGIALCGFALFLRLFQLTTLPVWPMWDDAYHAYYAIHQMLHWSFQMYFTVEHVQFPFYWFYALYYKIFPPSLISLWMFPALCSIVLLPIGYWACRQHFSRNFSFLFILVLAFSFWPIYLGKFCLSTGLQLIWEFIALGLLGSTLKHQNFPEFQWRLLGLGIWMGLGFYMYVIAYPTIGLLSLGMVCFCLYQRKNWRGVTNGLALVIPMILLFLPLVPGFTADVKGGHVHDYMVYGSGRVSYHQIITSLSYLTAILWGTVDKSYFNFGPLWGGYFNPFLGSAFLIGWIELFRSGKKVLFWGAVCVFTGYILPGFLSNTTEMMRILHVMPFCLLLAALGIQRLVTIFPKQRQVFILILIMTLSLSLDVYHLWGPYHRWAVPDKDSAGSKSPEHFRAFQIIEKWHEEKGNGLVFSDFYFDVFDQSLYVTTYGFNAVANPGLSSSLAQWAAILIGPPEKSLLEKRFPSATFYNLSKGLDSSKFPVFLAMVPISSENKNVFLSWVPIHQEVQNLYPEIPFHVFPPSYDKVLWDLWAIYPGISKDPFLRECFLEKISEYLWGNGNMLCALPLLNIPLEDIPRSEQFDFKFAKVFHRLGLAFMQLGKYDTARVCFLRAAHCDSRYPLDEVISILEKSRLK